MITPWHRKVNGACFTPRDQRRLFSEGRPPVHSSLFVLAVDQQQSLWDQLPDWMGAFQLVLLILSGVLLAIYGVGMVLYQWHAYPRTLVRGSLRYWDANETEPASVQAINLSALRKQTVIISFDPANLAADHIIRGSLYRYDLTLANSAERRGVKFWLGWRTLRRRRQPVHYTLQTSQPGIFIYRQKIYTRRIIYPGESFVSGCHVFTYQNEETARQPAAVSGYDVLEGRL